VIRLRTAVTALVLLASVAATAAQAQMVTQTGASARRGRATVVQTPPIIDGRLDDDVWRSAEVLSDFVQREPVEGNPVSERTEVRILTDGEALYVGAWLYDREAHLIVPSEKIRDVTLTNSDYFAFILDTYHDRQNGFVFGTTPSGVEHDAQVIREGEGGGVFTAGGNRAQAGALGGVNLNWDASWTVRTSQDSLGWYAEFRIPYSTIRYGAGATQTWGLNIMRGIRRRNEEALWSRVSRQFSLNRLSQAGTLEELPVPSQRIATVTPYVLGTSNRAYATMPDFRSTGEVGLDAKYGITPSLTLDLTYNTDFAQVEVDEQRTNLTRFPLFFPEKRPFFLENAGVFAAGTPQAVDLFFTRRIGIDSVGQPVPILGGGRLTGRIGGLTVGALQMITGEQNGVEGNSYTVLRTLKELSARSRVGVMAVQRQRLGDGDDHNRVYGVDGRVGIGQAWTADAWFGRSETPGRDGDANAWSGRLAYQTRDWNHSVRMLQVGDDFNPEVGFMSRPAGYRFDELMLMRLVRSPRWKEVRQWNPHISLRRYVGHRRLHAVHLGAHRPHRGRVQRRRPIRARHQRLHGRAAGAVHHRPGRGAATGPVPLLAPRHRLGLRPERAALVPRAHRGGPVLLGDQAGRQRDGDRPPRRGLLVGPHVRPPGRRPPRGRLRARPHRREARLLLHAADLRPVAHAIQQPGGDLHRERALRLAPHGQHRPLRRAQRRRAGGQLHTVAHADLARDHGEVLLPAR
jgi:hypothetical protein